MSAAAGRMTSITAASAKNIDKRNRALTTPSSRKNDRGVEFTRYLCSRQMTPETRRHTDQVLVRFSSKLSLIRTDHHRPSGAAEPRPRGPVVPVRTHLFS